MRRPKGIHTNNKKMTKEDIRKIVGIIIVIMLALFVAYKLAILNRSSKILKELENEVYSRCARSRTNAKENEPTREIDFEALCGINSDVVGWIHIANTNINYPIMQSKDNKYYKKKDLYKKKSSYGSIFLDSETNADFSDSNVVIYGRKLKNDKLFSDLGKIEDGTVGENVVIEIYLKDASYRYQVRSAYTAELTSNIIRKTISDVDKENYLNTEISKSNVNFSNPENTSLNNMLTLITFNGKKRTVVKATRIISVETPETSETQ